MRIDLHPGQECTVLEVIGNLHESKTIVPGQTHLILAKIRIGQVESTAIESHQSSEGMIAQLQSHLGDTISSYLTVRLTYKHSGYPNHKPIHVDGMKLRLTRIETEATATIKRRHPDSAWSPRASRTTSNPIKLSPLVMLIEHYLPHEQAVEVKKRLIDDRSVVSVARKLSRWSRESHEHTGGYNDESGADGLDALLSHPQQLELDEESTSGGIESSLTYATCLCLSSIPDSIADTDEMLADIDPARKIWSQMKMTSRGRHVTMRASSQSYASENSTKTPERSGPSPFRRQKSKSEGTNDVDSVSFERGRIFDEALKNKRSVGANTLRSIAPSVAKLEEKSKRGSTAGVGLAVGRGWGWTPAWW